MRSIDAVWTSADGFHWIRRGSDRQHHRPEDRAVVDTLTAEVGLKVRWDLPSVGVGCTSYPLEVLVP